MAVQRVPGDADDQRSTSEYVSGCRLEAGLSIDELAAAVGVSPAWLAAFEAGDATDELSYELLLALVRATQPPRPAWWDDGHEHDLHLGPDGLATRDPGTENYWARIEGVRKANRLRSRDG